MQRLSSIALLILFLTAQVGLTFGTHYCQGEAVRSNILWTSSKVPGCGMELDEANCESSEKASFHKHCCEDELTTVRNERDQLPSAPTQLELPKQKFELLHTTFSEDISGPTLKKGPDGERSPPSGLSASRLYSVRFQIFRV